MNIFFRIFKILRSLLDPNAPRMILFLAKEAMRTARERAGAPPRFLRSSIGAASQSTAGRRVRVALLIDEYFGGWDTAYGGYGFLARRLTAKYLPDEAMEIEVILHGHKVPGLVQRREIDGTQVYKLSTSDRLSRYWLKIRRYDIFLSIELTSIAAIALAPKQTPHILWIQDPRPQSEWDEIATVSLFPEPSYYDQRIYDYVADRQDRIRFVTQGVFLNELARELYSLKRSIPIEYAPNPIEIPGNTAQTAPKKDNLIIFLGRIDSVKRGWIFCEIAKRLPDYEFHVLGSIHNNVARNKAVLAPYIDDDGRSRIPNLHLQGHVDGAQKQQFLSRAKILVNTSIHEALPISFLEALAARTLIVSCRNPEGLTEKFGFYTGPVIGDGFDRVDAFIEGIHRIMRDEDLRANIAEKGFKYVHEFHSIERFQQTMRAVITDTVNRQSKRRRIERSEFA